MRGSQLAGTTCTVGQDRELQDVVEHRGSEENDHDLGMISASTFKGIYIQKYCTDSQ